MHHIINEDDRDVIYIERDFRLLYFRGLQLEDIIPVHGDVKYSDRYLLLFDSLDLFLNSFGEVDAPGPDTDEAQIARPIILFQDMVGNSTDASFNRLLVEQDGCFHPVH